MTPLLDQLLFPQRLAARAMKDLRRIADAAVSIAGLTSDLRRELGPLMQWTDHVGETLTSMRDEISHVRGALEPMSDDLDALRAAFAGTNDKLERLRQTITPELNSVSAATEGLHTEVHRHCESIDELDSHVKEMGQNP